MLVIDASVAVAASFATGGFDELHEQQLVAPALMWSEARSALHELLRRRELTQADAEAARTRLEAAPVKLRRHRALGERAWRIAHELGWAKTYDAEYVALAQLLDCRLVTLDARLRRSTERLALVVSPLEI